MGNRHSQYSTTHTPWTHRSRRRNEKYKPRVHYGDGSFFQPEKDPYAYYTVTSSRKYDRRTGKLLRETHDPIHISPRIDERGIVTYSVEPTNPHEDPDRLAFFEGVVNSGGGSNSVRPRYDNPTFSHSHRHRYTSNSGIDHSRRYDDGAYRSDEYDSGFDNEHYRRRSKRRKERGDSHRKRWREDGRRCDCGDVCEECA